MLKELKNHVLKICLCLFFTTNAFAGLWVEPFLGYSSSTGKITLSNSGPFNGDYEFDYSGTQIGARVGYAFPIALVVGLDYRMGSIDSEQSSGPQTLETGTVENDETSLGIFAAFTTLPLFNFWAVYRFDYETEVTSGDGVGDTFSGAGFGVGAGFTGLPFVSLNLEIFRSTMDERFDASANTTTSLPTNSQSEQDITSVVLSVSAPFDLL